jgi:hypothetical protein
LGPLVLDVIHFRTTASGLNQIRGGDLAALVVVVPVRMAVGWLAWQGHPAAPVLALAPAIPLAPRIGQPAKKHPGH